MNDPTFWETARLGLGAFLTSPGAGLIGLLGAAWMAFVGVGKRLDGDRDIAREARRDEHEKAAEADARERWQWFYQRLWTIEKSSRPMPCSQELSR